MLDRDSELNDVMDTIASEVRGAGFAVKAVLEDYREGGVPNLDIAGDVLAFIETTFSNIAREIEEVGEHAVWASEPPQDSGAQDVA